MAHFVPLFLLPANPPRATSVRFRDNLPPTRRPGLYGWRSIPHHAQS
jgi:hypothetical protein